MTRFIDPAPGPIVEATDLGSVGVLKRGNLFLLTDPSGDIDPDDRGLGLYEADTRRLSCCTLRVNGRRPVRLSATIGGSFRGTIVLANPRVEAAAPGGPTLEDAGPAQWLAIERHRLLTGTELEERLRITCHAEAARDVTLHIELAADAADIFEVRGWDRPARGRQLPIAVRDDRVTFRYDGLDGVRTRTHVAFDEPAQVVAATRAPGDGMAGELARTARTAGTVANGWVRLEWRWRLEPGERRELRWVTWTSSGGRAAEPNRPFAGEPHRPAAGEPAGSPDRPFAGEPDDADDVLFPPVPVVDEAAVAAAARDWRRGMAAIATGNPDLDRVIDRSASDLYLLLDDGPGPGRHHLAAGVPWFATLFGRDAIIASLQVLPFRPDLAIDTLQVLASLQATTDDPARDAEPGKILHELRRGELARTGEIPHRPYYGTADATPLWLVLLGATYDWTGDRALVDRLWPNVLRALEWIDRYGDRDGDGFVDYERRTPGGLVNQGWKDSPDGIRDRHGRLAATPIALAEVQGYVFDARQRMAALARLRGEGELADRLTARAEELRARFEDAFWSEDQGCYAIALGGDGRAADAIASNAGHCLWSGIAAPDRARRVVERLMAPDMFSGWGIRTYAAGQPGYNPIGYHTGTVWPHDVSLIAAGFKRYGYDAAAGRLAGGMLEAAHRFPDQRLPELFCGFDRDETAAPVPYPVACSPQAWAAGSSFMLLATLLGLRADAGHHRLELARPELPEWLPELTVTGLRVGSETADLRFRGDRDGTSVVVLANSPGLTVTTRAPGA